MTQQPFQNRLIKEKSPYLLQHAHNPVDWYPWGEEAFERAKSEDKPIFLSIGYATCHWCHVMARESFANPEIAKELNQSFINIKVDREELPEIDSLYMEFAQAIMASGTGWPLNVILTPDLKPFYAVTYLPPTERQGIMGLKQLIHHIEKLWHSGEKELLFDQANKLVDLFEKSVLTRGDVLPTEEMIDEALEELFEAADPIFGGMKGAPKFPLGYQCQFFLNYAASFQEPRSLFFAEKTLEKMHQGGIYDHLGGGFSRYSVDDKWLVPHFEKMLYDNAILGGAYLDAYRLTGKNNYRVICIEILEYILREMSHPKGGFYSAEDAETDGVEGAFYLWTKKEVFSLLPSQEATLFCEYYDVTEEGNFEGKNILHPVYPLEEFVDYKGIDQEMVEQSLKRSRAILFEARATRKRPFKDDKILTSWNALMIDTLARCGFAFGEKRFIDAARLAAEFIRENLWKEGKLLRRYREGATDYEGSLDDYVFMIRALITLYEGGLGEKYLEWAIEMAHLLEREFKADEGAFYLTGPNHSILLRRCELYDSSLPSGNAVHAENLIRLYQITYHRDFWIQAEDILKVARAFLEAFAQGACYHLLSMHRYFNKQLPNLVIALKDKEEGKAELQKHLFSRLYPHLAFSWKEGESEYPLKEGKTTFYLCIHGKCQPPLTDWDALEKALESLN